MPRFVYLLAVPLAAASVAASAPGLQVIDRAAPVVLHGPRLSRTIASDIPVELPLTVRTLGSAVDRLGWRERIPLGIEDSATPLKGGAENEWPRTLTGLTVKDALDGLTRLSSTYEWRQLDTVVVIRPKNEWQNAENVLNRRVGAVEWKNVTFEDALDKTMSLVARQQYRTPQPAPEDRRFAVTLHDATLLDLLNAIVTQHGELTWHVSYKVDDPKEHFGIGFKTFDGHAKWIWIPDAELRRP
jgi:hypothetical protein